MVAKTLVVAPVRVKRELGFSGAFEWVDGAIF